MCPVGVKILFVYLFVYFYGELWFKEGSSTSAFLVCLETPKGFLLAILLAALSSNVTLGQTGPHSSFRDQHTPLALTLVWAWFCPLSWALDFACVPQCFLCSPRWSCCFCKVSWEAHCSAPHQWISDKGITGKWGRESSLDFASLVIWRSTGTPGLLMLLCSSFGHCWSPHVHWVCEQVVFCLSAHQMLRTGRLPDLHTPLPLKPVSRPFFPYHRPQGFVPIASLFPDILIFTLYPSSGPIYKVEFIFRDSSFSHCSFIYFSHSSSHFKELLFHTYFTTNHTGKWRLWGRMQLITRNATIYVRFLALMCPSPRTPCRVVLGKIYMASAPVSLSAIFGTFLL